MRRLAVWGVLAVAVAVAARADVTQCRCDPRKPETLEARECSLCREAEQRPGSSVFFLKDINPRKPNRWLVLPHAHGTVGHALHDLTPRERTELWTAAIAKARELWSEEWGLAYNGERVRTQCHLHIHIGKLLKGIETGRFIVVRTPSEIPAPTGEGLWIHPHGRRLHVHLGEQTTETVLLR